MNTPSEMTADELTTAAAELLDKAYRHDFERAENAAVATALLALAADLRSLRAGDRTATITASVTGKPCKHCGETVRWLAGHDKAAWRGEGGSDYCDRAPSQSGYRRHEA